MTKLQKLAQLELARRAIARELAEGEMETVAGGAPEERDPESLKVIEVSLIAASDQLYRAMKLDPRWDVVDMAEAAQRFPVLVKALKTLETVHSSDLRCTDPMPHWRDVYNAYMMDRGD